MTAIQHFLIFKLLLRPLDLSHHVERQKLMVSSWEEIAVRPENGRYNFGSNVVFDLWEQLYKSRKVNKNNILNQI